PVVVGARLPATASHLGARSGRRRVGDPRCLLLAGAVVTELLVEVRVLDARAGVLLLAACHLVSFSLEGVRDPYPQKMTSIPRTAARILLGSTMVAAGVLHLTVQRDEFQAQVPEWFPLDDDLTVLGSGAVEIALGAGLV